MAVERESVEHGFFEHVERIWRAEETYGLAKTISSLPQNIPATRVLLAIAAAQDARSV